jgi:hypothetical protein
MALACRIYIADMVNGHRIVVLKLEWKRPVGRHGCRWYAMKALEWRTLVGLYENSKEPMNFIKCWNFWWMNDY